MGFVGWRVRTLALLESARVRCTSLQFVRLVNPLSKRRKPGSRTKHDYTHVPELIATVLEACGAFVGRILRCGLFSIIIDPRRYDHATASTGVKRTSQPSTTACNLES